MIYTISQKKMVSFDVVFKKKPAVKDSVVSSFSKSEVEDIDYITNGTQINNTSYTSHTEGYSNNHYVEKAISIPSKYYCTKMVSFPSSYFLGVIKEIFFEAQTDNMFLNDIYQHLQIKLKVKSVNKSNLRSFLSYAMIGDVVFLQKIEIMYDACQNSIFCIDCEENHIETFFNEIIINNEDDLNYHFSKTKKAPKDFMLKSIKDIFDELNSIELTIEDIYRELSTKLGIANINKSNLVSLIGVNGSLISKKAIEKRTDEFKRKLDEYYQFELEKNVCLIKNRIKNIHIDNYGINIKDAVRPNFYRFFEAISVKRVSDIKKMSDDDIREMLKTFGKACLDFFSELDESFAVVLGEKFKTLVIEQINKNGEKITHWDRNVEIIYKRARGETLAAAGSEYGLTRERVRQIEVKYMKKFELFASSCYGGLIKSLKMFAKNKSFITTQELSTIINQFFPAFCYFLKLYENEDICYVDELDAFAFTRPIDWYALIIDNASELPATMHKRIMEESIDAMKDRLLEYNLDIPSSFVEKLFRCEYKQNGNYYSKNRMPLREKYEKVIEKWFPQGMHIYDDNEMQLFRDYYAKMFSKDELPENNRPIYAAISSKTILCDRGIYKSFKNSVYPTELLEEICQYIDQNKQEVMAYGGLYYIFEKKLIESGVTNRYYLQGLLRRYAGDRYFFTRDYVSKSKNAVSLYSLIVSFIKDSDCIVSKEDLLQEFPGVTQAMFCFALSNDDIIVGQSLYAHKDYILNNQGYIDTLRYIMSDIVKDGKIHNSSELMAKLKDNFPSLMKDFKIADRYFLFSIVEALFEDEFSLRRPFFAKKGTVIDNQQERIIEFVKERGCVELSELMGFIYSNKFVFSSIISMLNSICGNVYILDKDTLIDSDLVSFDEAMIGQVESLLPMMLNKIGCIIKGTDFSKLPTINMQWNEWLLYSVIQKYSKKYVVSTTDISFSNASPVFNKI